MRFLIWFLLAFCLVCCETSTTGRTESSYEDDTTALRIGVLPTVECLPLYAAAETGVFDSLGLSVRLVTFEAAMDADTAFFRGHVDGVAADLVKAVLWKSQGDSIRMALSADLNLHLVTSRPSRLKTGESLKERIVAFTRNSALDYTADGMLAASKLQSEQLNKPQINNIQSLMLPWQRRRATISCFRHKTSNATIRSLPSSCTTRSSAAVATMW